ncbi:ATP phosphoribosyltransferase regulatory subunit [Paenibacillus xerothermodurans]|uniref:ATP phosphoribosyltransferase regulatory subunit n=1 Tax=Paenibacillus xerothermodurans TaxID=1977292 RepID=A0A2W1N3J5_PAEXE|nr:ATP phosphoribosyltransferase regulatory subunit [Paenibacillus xerothermodurans]PZE19299.1 ATP phosphoribosyltransferase regulatory subunit [Paenibacillus xerothermodurans]
MSKPKVFEKPAGVKDYLPEAVGKLRAIETNVLQCMESWGYREIMTPTLEFYDTVGVASSTEDRKLFKLLDRKGTTLVMRSDMTAPIARVVSSLLQEQPFPIRLSYHANVFRAIEEEAGRDAEFFQTGVELVGDASSESDAEVIALAIACLQAAGVQEFKIALGHVGFLTGLFEETLQEHKDAQHSLKRCLLNRDHVGYREIIRSLALPDTVSQELEGVLRLRGGQEICEQARQVTADPTAQKSISHLCQVWDVLQAYGVSDHVMIDLTMIGDFSYYTGMTFEGYAADLGFPVCNGGRYDNLLTHFGRPAPATGFALKTNRILEVVGTRPDRPTHRQLVVYSASRRAEAFKIAGELRAREGAVVETRLREDGAQAVKVIRQGDDSYLVNGVLYQDVIELV